MAFKFNGIDLKNVIFNGVSLGKVIFNGVTVWVKEKFIYISGNTALSNGCTVAVTSGTASTGGYEYKYGSFNIFAQAYGTKGVTLTAFDVTNFDTLEIVAKTNVAIPTPNFAADFTVIDKDGNRIYNQNIFTTDFKKYTVDISNLKGVMKLDFWCECWGSSSNWIILYMDSIRVY